MSNATSKKSASLTRRLWQEPLLRFGLIGIVIFALNAWRSPPQTPPNDSIVIAQSRIDNWHQQYRASNGRNPSTAELNNTITQWVDEEVLYRQALQLGLHQNDSIVRRQLIQKMNFVIEGATPLPPATDAQLQAFMQRKPTAYGTAAKLSFQQVFLSRGNHGNALARKATQLLHMLQNAPDSYKGQGDSFILGQHIHNASNQLLRKHFGKQFVTAVQALPASDHWQGPVESGLGLHLVRVTQRNEFQAPRLQEVRKKVALDYRLAQEKIARRQALNQLQQHYHIVIENPIESQPAAAHAQ